MDFKLIEQLLTIGASIVSLIVFSFSVVICILNKIKKHKNGECEKDAQDENILIKDIIPFAIEKAEESHVGNGALKKMLALSDILLSCQDANIDYGKYKTFIEEQLETLISFSKGVNKREKDQESGVIIHD